MNEKLIELVNNYLPFNEEEEKDKGLILDALKTFDNILLRENTICHITSSSWILNQNHDKVLMCYHKIYDSWSWTGGHADGDSNLLGVSIKEAKEETGVTHIKPVLTDPFSLEVLTVDGHQKNGKYVPSHLHLNITYLLEANDTDKLLIKLDENKGVSWFSLEDSLKAPTEAWMIEHIYKKLNQKLSKIELKK